MRISKNRLISCGVVILVLTAVLFTIGFGSSNTLERKIDKTISKMTLDEKVSQMIIPAMRTWNEENVTDLSAAPELKEALKKHQYGVIILFSANITGAEQVTRLINDLQENNMQIENASAHIPYLTPVDEGGGIVIRLSTGTRMTGNMAIGATEDAENNAEKRVLFLEKNLLQSALMLTLRRILM